MPMLVPPTPSVVRPGLLVLLCAIVCALLAACGGSDSPQAIAQQFADAVVKEDYTAAVAYLSPEFAAGDQATNALLPFIRTNMVQQYGALRAAVVQQPELTGVDAGTIVIVWQLERTDLATTWEVHQTEQRWRITALRSGSAQGQLSEAGTFATPTPTTRTLMVHVANVDQLQPTTLRESSVTLVERGETIALTPGGNVTFQAVPLGAYTLRVQVPGRTDSDTPLELRGDQAPPDPLIVKPGEALHVSNCATIGAVNRLIP